MTAQQIILGQLQTGEKMLQVFTADLTDAEYFKPATPGTNHTAWILIHLACTEDWSIAKLSNTAIQIPKTTHDAFGGGTTCDPDPAKHPSRGEIDKMFRTTRERLYAALASSDVGTWDDASPEGFPKEFFPTVGAVWSMQALHQYWHIGQLTTCRATLGKKRALV